MSKYYVRATGGSDSNSAATFALGWATLEYAINSITGGDTLCICSNSDNKFVITSGLRPPTSVGSVTSLVGCSLTDGTEYNGTGKAYVSTATGITNFIYISANNPMLIKDLDLDGGGVAGSGVAETLDNPVNKVLDNVAIHGFTVAGYHASGDSTSGVSIYSFNDIEVYDCAVGVLASTSSNLCVILYNCKIHNNTTYNISVINYACISLINSRIYKAGSHNIYLSGVRSCVVMHDSIVYGAGGNGVHCNGTSLRAGQCVNSIVANNAGYGWYEASVATIHITDYNCWYGNGLGNVNTNYNGGVISGNRNVFADPMFTNVADGEEDWTPLDESPLLASGKGYTGGQ